MYTYPYPNKEDHAATYRAERLREEDRQELVRQARAARPEQRRWYAPLLRLVGRGLVRTGQRLQAADRPAGTKPAAVSKHT